MNRSWKTIPQMALGQAKANLGKTVMRAKRRQTWQEISWQELASQVESIGLGLLDLGVQPGDRVAILSENRPEWAFADLSILSLRAATVPIYTTLTSSEIEYILRDCGASLIFISNPELMAKVTPFKERLNLKVVLFDAPYRVSGPRVWWWGELMGLGQTAGPESKAEWTQRLESGVGEDLASLIYTSGTTGPPKGVMLTHRNFLSNCEGVGQVLPVSSRDLHLSFLPLSHVFERMAGYYFVLFVGGAIAYAESLEKVPEDLLEVKPTILTGVPRFYEKLYERIQEAVRTAPPLKRRIFHWALRIGAKEANARLNLRPVSVGLKLKHRVASALVFTKLRHRLGGRIRFCVSGGAPLSKELAEFFYSAGILVLEGYGLTETSPVIAVNRPDKFKFGTVGPALPGVEVRLASDGEILTRGPHVMKGYFHKPEETKEVIDAQGWFHTGDIGAVDQEGFLKITDRKKDIIKTSGGKMIAPQNLENALRRDPFISDCVVIGDRRKYVTALIVPEFSRLEDFARIKKIPYQGLQELVRHPEVERLVWQRVEELNRSLASFEQIKKITLIAQPFTMSGGELTPTLKVKRQVVAQRYAALIETMYD